MVTCSAMVTQELPGGEGEGTSSASAARWAAGVMCCWRGGGHDGLRAAAAGWRGGGTRWAARVLLAAVWRRARWGAGGWGAARGGPAVGGALEAGAGGGALGGAVLRAGEKENR
jgi:hypothetical protein